MPLRPIAYGGDRPPLRLPPPPSLVFRSGALEELDRRFKSRRPAAATLQQHQARLASCNQRPLSRDEAERIGYPSAEIDAYFSPRQSAPPNGAALRGTRHADGTHISPDGRITLHLPSNASEGEIQALLFGFEEGMLKMESIVDAALAQYTSTRTTRDL